MGCPGTGIAVSKETIQDIVSLVQQVVNLAVEHKTAQVHNSTEAMGVTLHMTQQLWHRSSSANHKTYTAQTLGSRSCDSIVAVNVIIRNLA